jgi:hypothetical protein
MRHALAAGAEADEAVPAGATISWLSKDAEASGAN